MGLGDYEWGRQHPHELPSSGFTNFDVQQGQMDALKEQHEKMHGTPAGPVPNMPANSAVAWGPPLIFPKKVWVAVVLCLLFGPLGLFYATKKGALILIGILLAVPMVTHSLDNGPFMGLWLEGSMVVSLIWSVVAVKLHNGRIR
jgi:hypothetical protein